MGDLVDRGLQSRLWGPKLLPGHWQSSDWAGRQPDCNIDMRDQEAGEILHHLTFGPPAGESTPRAPRKFWGLNSQTPNQTFDYAIFVSILQLLTTSQVFCKLFFQIHVCFHFSAIWIDKWWRLRTEQKMFQVWPVNRRRKKRPKELTQDWKHCVQVRH